MLDKRTNIRNYIDRPLLDHYLLFSKKENFMHSLIFDELGICYRNLAIWD